MDPQTIETYNKLATDYDEETLDFWDRFPNSILTTFSDEIAGDRHVLDVGSGPGRDGLLLREHGIDVSCLDASAEMVRLCRDRGLTAVEGDLLALPFSDGMFDGVWAYTSLLHIRKKAMYTALQEIARVLKKGGVLGLGMIEGDQELYRESSGVGLPRWFAFYTENELETLLKESGFEILYFEAFKPKSKRYLNYIARSALLP
jgi:ubiquinone/menaquinone biosynthesis C-methylase UbiE